MKEVPVPPPEACTVIPDMVLFDIAAAEEETFRKRYSDLRRFQQQKEAEANKEVAALKAQITQLSAAQNAPLPKTREEFESWKAKYPDIVGFIEIIAWSTG